jgi:hypothetical protein
MQQSENECIFNFENNIKDLKRKVEELKEDLLKYKNEEGDDNKKEIIEKYEKVHNPISDFEENDENSVCTKVINLNKEWNKLVGHFLYQINLYKNSHMKNTFIDRYIETLNEFKLKIENKTFLLKEDEKRLICLQNYVKELHEKKQLLKNINVHTLKMNINKLKIDETKYNDCDKIINHVNDFNKSIILLVENLKSVIQKNPRDTFHFHHLINNFILIKITSKIEQYQHIPPLNTKDILSSKQTPSSLKNKITEKWMKWKPKLNWSTFRKNKGGKKNKTKIKIKTKTKTKKHKIMYKKKYKNTMR